MPPRPLSSAGEPLPSRSLVTQSTEKYKHLPTNTPNLPLRSCLVLFVNLLPGRGLLRGPTYRVWRIDHRHVVAVLEGRSKRRYQRYHGKHKRHFLRRGKKTHNHLKSTFGFRHKYCPVKIKRYPKTCPCDSSLPAAAVGCFP